MEAEVKTKKLGTGNIKTMEIKLESPTKMDFEAMDVKSLMIFVGANGTGKTLILTFSYVMMFIIQTAVGSLLAKQVFDAMEVAQFVIKNCFANHEEVTGSIACETINGSTLNLEIDKGIVTHCRVSNIAYANITQNVIYMSSNLRLFTAIAQYLKTRKLIVGNGAVGLEQIVTQMLEHYKLYDVMAIERLIQYMPFDVPPELAKIFKDSYDMTDNITGFNVDPVKGEFYAIIDGDKRKDLSTYGNGHQSAINMTLTQFIS